MCNTYVHLNGYVDGYALDGLRSPKKSDSTQLNEASRKTAMGDVEMLRFPGKNGTCRENIWIKHGISQE